METPDVGRKQLPKKQFDQLYSFSTTYYVPLNVLVLLAHEGFSLEEIEARCQEAVEERKPDLSIIK